MVLKRKKGKKEPRIHAFKILFSVQYLVSLLAEINKFLTDGEGERVSGDRG